VLGEEDQTMEADTLLQPENAIKQKQATGGSSNQGSEEDSEYDLEPSTSGGNPSFQPGI